VRLTKASLAFSSTTCQAISKNETKLVFSDVLNVFCHLPPQLCKEKTL
jgi:hypothetical protein